jgi:mono/diheme cytochrome c family protein
MSRSVRRQSPATAPFARGAALGRGRLLVAVLAAAVAGACAPRGGAEEPAAAAGGAALWAANCARCHNMRPSDNYGSEEWGIIMIHMRIRSNLTGGEARAIRAFLESGQ